MSELANYSIETDNSVWLSFKDGHNLRVSVGQLPRYLTPHDLQKVRRAMKLRRDFFRQHMPKTLLLAAALGLTALAVTSGQALAHLWQVNQGMPDSLTREIVRNIMPATPAPSAAPQPAAGSSVAAVPGDKHRPAAARVQPAPSITPSQLASQAAAATPIARPGIDAGFHVTAPTPTPQPAGVPTPSPSPAPVEPQAGPANTPAD